MNKRLIEVSHPLAEVFTQSVREKSIWHGHISTLHIWWCALSNEGGLRRSYLGRRIGLSKDANK